MSKHRWTGFKAKDLKDIKLALVGYLNTKPFEYGLKTSLSKEIYSIYYDNPAHCVKLYENDKVVGRATGGDYGFRLGKSIALGMVNPNVATTGQKLKIDILGKMYDATILDESPYDPENNLLRA